MLNWGRPGLFWLGLSILPIIFFYFLRMRFRQQPVSSIYLWNRLKMITQRGSRLRWRSLLLLLLQLGAASAAVLAATQPFWNSQFLARPGTVFLVDVSASMNAKDVTNPAKKGFSRLDQARTLLIKEIRKLPPGAAGMVFLCAGGAEPLGNPFKNREQLIAKVKTIKASEAGFLEDKVTDDLQAWLTTHNQPWQACLISDGGLDLGGTKLARVFNGSFRSILVGGNSNNIGVTGLRLLSGQAAQYVVNNGWSNPHQVRVTLKRDGLELTGSTVTVSPGINTYRLPFNQGHLPGVYQIRLEQVEDIQPLDDYFYLAVNSPRRFRVLWVGPDNPFLRSALSNPGILLTKTASFPGPDFNGADWDLIIADRVSVPLNLQCNVLIFNQSGPFASRNQLSGPLMASNSTHPLLRFLDWQNVMVYNGNSLRINSGTQVLASVNGAPMIATWEQNNHHWVACGTDLFHSDLGLSGAFPMFLQNILQWCVPQGGNSLADTLTVGELAVRAEAPQWRIIENDSFQVKQHGSLLDIKPLTSGVFHWVQGTKRGFLVVNPPAGELDLFPRTVHVSKKQMRLAAEYSSRQKSLIQLSLLILLVCLCFEWVIWRGGWHFSRRRAA